MKKIWHYFALFIIFCATGASITLFTYADVFEEIFKNVDWEQLAKDMENMLAAEEEKEEDKKMETEAQIPPTIKKVVPETVIETEIKKDPKTLFINPDMQLIQVKGKTVTEPTSESRRALQQLIKEMLSSIKTLEQNLWVNKDISPQFKDIYLPELIKELDAIVIAINAIGSKKIYEKKFLEAEPEALPQKNSEKTKKPEISMQQLRKQYLTLLEKLNDLNKKIEAKEDDDQEKLKEILLKEQTQLPKYEPLTPVTPKKRGLSSDNKSTEQTKKGDKE